MPAIPLPLPQPIPIPWPHPSPGVGTPAPSPGVGVSPGIGIPIPTAPTPNLTGGGFGGLFKFSLDWRFLGALLFILLTVGIVDEVWPEWAWPYVGILLSGLLAVNHVKFSEGFDRLLKGV
jgi:hypothetical protein